MIGRTSVFCLLWFAGSLSSRGGDASGLSGLNRSLSNFENRARNAFVEDAGEEPSPAPKRHSKSNSSRTATRHKAYKHSAAGKSSPGTEVDVSDGGQKTHSRSESVAKSKRERARSDDDGSAVPNSTPNPSATPAPGAGAVSDQKTGATVSTASIKPEALEGFFRQPIEVQQLIRSSLALTEQNLSYKYGSADPSAGGMDCSGFIYYVLSNAGCKDVPRDSAEQYAWVRKQGDFRAVLSRSADSFEFNELKPGDLLFWSGTYEADRDIPITHVMIYLGKTKSAGKPVMVGSTDGRSYDGIRRYGVSIFDFKMPNGKPNPADPDLTTRFEGYAHIPGLRTCNSAVPSSPDDEAGGER